MTVRPRRSVLYLPGSNARALEKARSLPADGLILDLEDAVAPSAKAEARAQVLAALAAGGYGRRERVVRVNGAGTPWGLDDLEAAARSGADAVCLPKVERAEEVRAADRALAAHGRAGLARALVHDSRPRAACSPPTPSPAPRRGWPAWWRGRATS